MGISQAICGLALKAEVNSNVWYTTYIFVSLISWTNSNPFISGLSKWMVYQHKQNSITSQCYDDYFWLWNWLWACP